MANNYRNNYFDTMLIDCLFKHKIKLRFFKNLLVTEYFIILDLIMNAVN